MFVFIHHQLGKAAFQRHNDPLDAALFYLAMKKKAVLWGLFRYIITDAFIIFQRRSNFSDYSHLTFILTCEFMIF